MSSLFVKLLVVFCALAGLISAERLYANLDGRRDVAQGTRSDGSKMHEVIFAIKPRNMESLEKTVHDISNMKSPNYGKHLTRAQLSELTANPTSNAHLTGILSQYPETKILKHSRDGRFVTVEAPIKLWEKFFNAEFYSFSRSNMNGVVDLVVDRAVHYEIPSILAEHVDAVFNTVQVPPTSKAGTKISSRTGVYEVTGNPPPTPIKYGSVTPDLLDTYYEIPSNNGNNLGSQSLYESLDQDYSPDDLAGFQENFDIALQEVAGVIGGHNSSAVCVADMYNCTEANLDVQYMMAVAQNVPTIYYYDSSDDFLLTWAQDLLDMENPPLINSISYAEYEKVLDYAYINTFEQSAVMLSALGVTIFAASGDDGVAGWLVRGDAQNCGYYPMWPATSPYVIAVGGTQGPEKEQPEISCSSSTGGIITSGGGFSNLYPMPEWQLEAVAAGYFSEVSITGLQPTAGYNNSGRAYPDISSMAYNYYILNGGEWVLVSGTSASTPVTAAFFSLVNSARLAKGKSALGWMNPSIYEYGTQFTNDITFGNNDCGAQSNGTITCCEEGFDALPGWDPVTGFGSVNYANFYDVFGPGGTATDDDDDSGSHSNSGLSDQGVIAVGVVGGIVGAGAIGSAAYYGLFASKGTLNTPLLDPVESTTKSPMV